MMKQLLGFFALALALLPFHAQAEARTEGNLQIETLATGLSIPWGIAVMPDRSLLITQRGGRLTRLDPDSGQSRDIDGLPAVRVEGQGGLFDVALPPDHDETGWIYFSYNKDVDGQGATTLARARMQHDSLTDWSDLLVTQSRTGNKAHYGGRIAFDGQGHVFLSIGDRGTRPTAQDLGNHAGSILRLNMDGSVPADNPFVGRDDALPEIWSYGHRNPQGLYYNEETGALWSIEHGPRGGDEINLVEPGRNYGWPEISYGKEYWGPISVGKGTHREGMEQPVQIFTPSIAPSSLIQYRGTLFDGWQGSLLAGALKLQHLNRVELAEDNTVLNEQRLLESLSRRLRSLAEGPEGELYIGADNGDIYRITPSDRSR